jgi:hypothetical protein
MVERPTHFVLPDTGQHLIMQTFTSALQPINRFPLKWGMNRMALPQGLLVRNTLSTLLRAHYEELLCRSIEM